MLLYFTSIIIELYLLFVLTLEHSSLKTAIIISK